VEEQVHGSNACAKQKEAFHEPVCLFRKLSSEQIALVTQGSSGGRIGRNCGEEFVDKGDALVDLVGCGRGVDDREALSLRCVRIGGTRSRRLGDLELVTAQNRGEFFPRAVGDLVVLRHLHEGIDSFGILAGHLGDHFGRDGLAGGAGRRFGHLKQCGEALRIGHIGEIDGIVEIGGFAFGGIGGGIGGAVGLENTESRAEFEVGNLIGRGDGE
jgi:hypothetical protein